MADREQFFKSNISGHNFYSAPIVLVEWYAESESQTFTSEMIDLNDFICQFWVVYFIIFF